MAPLAESRGMLAALGWAKITGMHFRSFVSTGHTVVSRVPQICECEENLQMWLCLRNAISEMAEFANSQIY